MITTKIQLKPHLAEYLHGKYPDKDSPQWVHLPGELDLYHVIWDLMQKRPQHCPVDRGNVTLLLPVRRIGKDPEYYNYLGQRSQNIIDDKVEAMFYAELHHELDTNKHTEGIQYQDTVHLFMCKYCIESITSDALLKNYYRWRDKIRKKKQRRKYTRTKKI